MPGNFRPYKRKRKGGSSSGRGMKRQRAKGPTLSTAQIKRLIRSEQETKHVDATFLHLVTEATQPVAMTLTYANEGIPGVTTNSHPSITTGSASYQRVGNKCRLMHMEFKAHVYSLPSFEVVASYPSIVRIMVVQYTEAVTNANSFLDTVDSIPSTAPVLANYRTDPATPYRVLYDRVLSPDRIKGFADIGSVPTYCVGGESYLVRKSIRINRDVGFGSQTSTAPNNNPIGIYCFVDDDNTASTVPEWRIRGTVRFFYKDS